MGINAWAVREGVTLTGKFHSAKGPDGQVQTVLEAIDSQGKPDSVYVDGDASKYAKTITAGERVSVYGNPGGGVRIRNDARESVTTVNPDGRFDTETFVRAGKVEELHHKNGLPDHEPGARANSIILEGNHHVHVSPGKDGGAVIDGTHPGDDVVVYKDGHGRPVIYNETQHTVSRADEHGKYHTQEQNHDRNSGEIDSIKRDPKNPDNAIITYTDSVGFTLEASVADPKHRLSALMKPGDMIDTTLRDAAPGQTSIEVVDKTRHTKYNVDHNGNVDVKAERIRPEAVPGVEHQHDNGRTTPVAPGASYHGTARQVSEHNGVIKLEFDDALNNKQALIIDTNSKNKETQQLAQAVHEHVNKGQDFNLAFKAGRFELIDIVSHEVITPGPTGPTVAPLPNAQQIAAPQVGGR